VNFLVDAQLPPGLARWLAVQGHSAQHVNDVGLAGAEDFVIWNHALGAMSYEKSCCLTCLRQSREVRDESKEVFISAQKILAKFNVFCLRRSLLARGFDVYSSLQVKPRRMFDCLGFSFDLHNRDHVKPLELLISFCFKLPGIRRILDDHVKPGAIELCSVARFCAFLGTAHSLLNSQPENCLTVPQVGPPSLPVPGTRVSITRDELDACSIIGQVMPVSGIFNRRLHGVFVCPA